jgi:hypothetical protein
VQAIADHHKQTWGDCSTWRYAIARGGNFRAACVNSRLVGGLLAAVYSEARECRVELRGQYEDPGSCS